MSSEYSVTKINSSKFDLNGIRLANGKTCCYWKNKGSNKINDVIVIMNNSNVVNVSNNQMCISLDGVTNGNDMLAMINAFLQEMKKMGINGKEFNFRFIVDNKKDVVTVNRIIDSLGIKGIIVKSDLYNSFSENLDEAIDNINNNDLVAGGNNKQINKYEEGSLKKYTISDDKVYDDNNNLSLAEQKKIKLSEWMNDPIKMQEIIGLSKEELDKRLTETVTIGIKTHYLESSNNNVRDNKVSSVANDKARMEDGKVNSELGIVKNNVSNNNQYSTVEENKGDVKVVNPTVSSYEVSSSNNNVVNFNDYSVDNSYALDNNKDNDTDLLKEEDTQRNIESEVYYLGSSGEIYNKDGKIVGRLGVGGYAVNENNNLLRYNNVIGVIGDINDMGVNKTEIKANVRVLKKPDRPVYSRNSKKSAAFVNLPVIIFIISLLLLIGSGIILFLMK